MHFPDIKELVELMEQYGITTYKLLEYIRLNESDEKKKKIGMSTINEIIRGKTKNPGYLTVTQLFETLHEMIRAKESKKENNAAGEICASPIIKLKASDTVLQANNLLDKHSQEISTFPIFDGEEVKGLVTDKSLRKIMYKHPKDWKKLNVMEAREPRPPIVDYRTPIKVLEKYLDDEPCVLVRQKSGNSILGIITNWDLRNREARKKPNLAH